MADMSNESVPADSVSHPLLDEFLEEMLEWADGQDTAFGRLLALRFYSERLRYWASMDVLGERRTAVVRELHEAGWSYRDIAKVAGVSLARVQQWIAGE